MARDPRQFVLRAFKNREIRDLMLQVLDLDLVRVEIAHDPSHGVIIYGPAGTRPCRIHTTISGVRAAQNVRSQLRRVGALPTG